MADGRRLFICQVIIYGGNQMSAQRIMAIILVAAGVLGLAYGGFSYTKETHEAELGPIELTVNEKEYVNVPVWMGVGMLVIGGILLVTDRKIR